MDIIKKVEARRAISRALVFDMDGTIADLYSVNKWLNKLRKESPTPYRDALPLTDMTTTVQLLNALKYYGYKVFVTTWCSKNGSDEYNKLVRKTKREWLDKFHFPVDRFHAVKYGRTKADCTRDFKGKQILFDDNEKVRKGWHLGEAVDVTIVDINEYLLNLLQNELKAIA